MRSINASPSGRPPPAPWRQWLRRGDPAAVALAHLAEPLALGLLVLTGVVLPGLGGPWAPVPACRWIHLLSGLVLLLVLAYRLLAGVGMGLRWLARRPNARLPWTTWPRSIGWRRLRDPVLEAAYQAALVVMLLSGVERYWVLRTGAPLLGLLSGPEVVSLHAVAAPYFYAALLLLSYVEGRRRARALLEELRSP